MPGGADWLRHNSGASASSGSGGGAEEGFPRSDWTFCEEDLAVGYKTGPDTWEELVTQRVFWGQSGIKLEISKRKKNLRIKYLKTQL